MKPRPRRLSEEELAQLVAEAKADVHARYSRDRLSDIALLQLARVAPECLDDDDLARLAALSRGEA